MTGSTAATPILDWRHPLVQELSAEAHGSERALLITAHRLITTRVRGLLLDGRFWHPRRNPTFRAAQG
ncbi:hypothetical protein FAF44_24375 [Nonomuraea sp. MG754425]|uniref:hypothetical protein n=1 Tax=Nonomuraea sp. MG754425 TaxID=2570319 RepID=UPI001F292000|nr:hypothetical protein [Nonomuraea sp. MG754425]MCF6471504.1 hypothetical protein [Nonomuraea sp. MG754425]